MSIDSGISLSIITITYQDPEGLERTIQSLYPLLESGIEWEHLIIDSSPKMNSSLISGLPGRWPLKHTIEEPRGIYPAMNCGIRESKGNWIWFLNGGDRLRDVSAVARTMEHFRNDPEIMIGLTGVDLFRANQYTYSVFPSDSLKRDVLRINRIPHQGIFYRKAVFEQIGDFDCSYRIRGDYEHLFRCVLAGFKSERFLERVAAYDMDGVSSDWRRSMNEVGTVLRSLKAKMPLSWYITLSASLYLERFRLHIVKGIANSPAGKILRPAWNALNRLISPR